MFEHHRQPMLPRTLFFWRVAKYGSVAFAILIGSLGIGVMGYHIFEGFTWIDSFVNASMILGGMGPVNEVHTIAGKLFAGFYALYSGIVFLLAASVLLAPIIHRFLHHFHLNVDSDGSSKD
jgi:hypothetical protein